MRVTLHILSGLREQRVISLEEGKYTLGRGNEALIQLPSRQISRQHAELIVDASGATVADNGSANGTALNGRFVTTARVRDRDQIALGDVVLEFRVEESTSPPSPQPFSASPSLYAAATRVAAKTLRPRALWPLFSLIFGAAFLSLAVTAGLSFRGYFSQRLHDEALRRAEGVVKLLAEKNREDLALRNELLLDVDSALREKGVRQALIVNPKGRILAPISRLDQVDNGPFVTEALAHNSDRPLLPSPKRTDGTYIYVQPIRTYDAKLGKYKILGVAKISFSPQDAIGSLYEANRLLFLMVAAALILAIVLGWVSARALALPITRLAERIHQWRSGQIYSHETPPFRDWAPLYEAVDLALDEDQK